MHNGTAILTLRADSSCALPNDHHPEESACAIVQLQGMWFYDLYFGLSLKLLSLN